MGVANIVHIQLPSLCTSNTEDDTRFCQNMFCKLKCFVISLKWIKFAFKLDLARIDKSDRAEFRFNKL